MEEREPITIEQVIDNEPAPPARRRFRFIAGLFDILTIIIVSFGLSRLFLISPSGTRYYDSRNQMMDIEDQYKITELVKGSKETYGHKLYSYEADYPNESRGRRVHQDDVGTYVVVNNKNISQECLNAYKNYISQDQQYMSARQNASLLNFAILGISLAIGEVVFLFIVPLCNKKRATFGKLIFKLRLVDFSSFLSPKWWQILIRFLFLLAIDTLLPLYFISQWILLLSPSLIAICTLLSPRKRTLHDTLSLTYVVEEYYYDEAKATDYASE